MDTRNDNQTGLPTGLGGLWRWSTTPPQSYLVYVVCLVLVLGLSYYAGTLNPKKKVGSTPPSAALPRS